MIESYNKILKFNENKSDVEVILKTEVPKKLYKYYALNNWSINNLIDEKIHFSHPYTLNDIMDGNFQLLNVDKTYEKFITRTNRRDVSKTEFTKELYKKSNEYYKHIGVFCLTDSFSNNLFWPHYTFEQGFSVEFNSKKFLSSFDNEKIKTIPISYEKLKSIDLDKYTIENSVVINGRPELETNINLGLYYVLSFKDCIWKYENEWRIVLKKENLGDLAHPLNLIDNQLYEEQLKNLNNRNININADSIEKIILSNLFFHKSRFCNQIRNEDIETFIFRNRNEDEIKQSKILFSFFQELKGKFNERLYQIDKHLDPVKNEFESKITFKLKIIKLDKNKLVIEESTVAKKDVYKKWLVIEYLENPADFPMLNFFLQLFVPNYPTAQDQTLPSS